MRILGTSLVLQTSSMHRIRCHRSRESLKLLCHVFSYSSLYIDLVVEAESSPIGRKFM